MRTTEISNLLHSDITEHKGISVRGKAPRGRVISFNHTRGDAYLEDYIQRNPAEPWDPLFSGYRHVGINRKSVHRLVIDTAKGVGIDATPDSLRYACALNLLRIGASDQNLANYMGLSEGRAYNLACALSFVKVEQRKLA